MAEKLSSMSKAQATSTEFCSATLCCMRWQELLSLHELGVGQTGMVNIVDKRSKDAANCVSGSEVIP
jgi:hypothetical protein